MSSSRRQLLEGKDKLFVIAKEYIDKLDRYKYEHPHLDNFISYVQDRIRYHKKQWMTMFDDNYYWGEHYFTSQVAQFEQLIKKEFSDAKYHIYKDSYETSMPRLIPKRRDPFEYYSSDDNETSSDSDFSSML